MQYQYPIIGGIGVIAVLVAMFAAQQMTSSHTENDIIKTVDKSSTLKQEQILLDNPDEIKGKIQVTNGVRHLVPLDKIRSGGPPKDGIPSIDDPEFVRADNVTFMADKDIVIGLEINGDARAYPLSILVWHEIVNDKVGEVPVAVTYCPLCYTNQIFERTIDEKVVEFGTSGKLYNSNLVMYDRLTDSYWSQALGQAITGELTGYELMAIPFDVISWADWKKIHPDTLVLTTETGYVRAYGVDPYGDYYTNPQIIFPVDNKDDRMQPKEIILGLSNIDLSGLHDSLMIGPPRNYDQYNDANEKLKIENSEMNHLKDQLQILEDDEKDLKSPRTWKIGFVLLFIATLTGVVTPSLWQHYGGQNPEIAALVGFLICLIIFLTYLGVELQKALEIKNNNAKN